MIQGGEIEEEEEAVEGEEEDLVVIGVEEGEEARAEGVESRRLVRWSLRKHAHANCHKGWPLVLWMLPRP